MTLKQPVLPDKLPEYNQEDLQSVAMTICTIIHMLSSISHNVPQQINPYLPYAESKRWCLASILANLKIPPEARGRGSPHTSDIEAYAYTSMPEIVAERLLKSLLKAVPLYCAHQQACGVPKGGQQIEVSEKLEHIQCSSQN